MPARAQIQAMVHIESSIPRGTTDASMKPQKASMVQVREVRIKQESECSIRTMGSKCKGFNRRGVRDYISPGMMKFP